MMRHIAIQEAPFDTAAELAALNAPGVGGIASFTGVVRGGDGLSALYLEHYPGMTERALERLADEAAARWPLAGCVVIHRVGRLAVGEAIVLVATASAHRAAALAATAYLIDQLKTRAPFWKAEEFGTGPRRWVEARESDEIAAQGWVNDLPPGADGL
jgi:molybdopterin synthase catalytic subunit